MIGQLAMMDSVAARELTPDQRARVAENRAAALERRVARLSAQVDGCSGRAAPVTTADASTSIHKELLYAKTHSHSRPQPGAGPLEPSGGPERLR